MAKIILLSLAVLSVAANGVFGSSCEKNYDMLGCYEERAPTNMLINDRHNINWGSIVEYMKGLACKCAAKAKEGEYAGFALHYYGECYGKSTAQLEALTEKSHQAHRCVGDQTYTKCDNESHAHCTGGDWAEGVYKFKSNQRAPENINGGLGEWKQWTICDKECGNGSMHRERNCDAPVPKGKGKDCSELGKLTESKACKIKDCPDMTGCTTMFTKYTAVSSPGIEHYSDRQGIDCGGNGHVLTMFHLHKTGEHFQYQYTCCSFKSASFCSNQRKYTVFNSFSNRNAVNLAKFIPYCGPKGFINSARIEPNFQGNQVRYNYECCKLANAWKALSSCYDKKTTYTHEGKGLIYYLGSQTVSCRAGYAISYYRLERNHGSGDKYRYRYRCCKANF